MNNLVFRIFGTVLVVVINSEIGASVAYGGDCSAGPTFCEDANNVCISDVCACSNTHFINNAGDTCVLITATHQCAVANQVCSLESGTANYKCQCTSAYYSDGSACQDRKAPTAACSYTGQCVTHANCTSSVCECDAGYTATATMCSGVVKFTTLPYMYVVPILVSMMSLI